MVFVSAFFLACVGLIQFLAPDWKLPTMVYWMQGTFAGADAAKVWTLAIPVIIGGAVFMLLRWRMNVLSLADMDARALGVPIVPLRWTLLIFVSLIVASQVATCDLIGWIGLIVPHCARMLVGPDHRRLLLVAALLGGLFVLGLDDLTRSIVHAEIPVGVLAAFFGTPIVGLLFWRTRTKGWTND